MRMAALRLSIMMVFAAGLLAAALPARAEDGDPPTPPTRRALEDVKPVKPLKQPDEDDENGLPFDIRTDAVKEAALSYGARGGLAWHTFEIRQELENKSGYLDKVFDFSQLLIAAPSGLLIEPPIVSEDENSMIIDAEGQEAAVSDRIYNISANARIVSSARLWRNYLERDWGEVTPPPEILMPENDEERQIWIENVRKGWDLGVAQADDIFEEDMMMLSADYQGMVRYRMLLAQGMISPPYALQVDRGVTGGGDQMRIGDRAIQISGKPQLKPGSDEWQPASR